MQWNGEELCPRRAGSGWGGVWMGAVLSFACLSACSEEGARPPDAGDDAGEDAGEDADVPELPPEQGWSMYGYDQANTQAYPHASSLDAKSVKDLAPRWRIRVGGGATSTPAVVDGVAYFGAWDGIFYAVDARTAEPKWRVPLGRQFIRDTPLVTKDRIYVGVDRELVCLSREDGSEIFRTTVVEHPQGFVESSPKRAGNVLILGVASFELNLDKDDYTFEGAVVGLAEKSGKKLWRVPVTGESQGVCQGGAGVSVWSSAAIDEERGLAYIGTGQTYEPPASTCNDSLLAIHYARKHEGERIAWKVTFTEDDVYVATGSGLMGLDHDIGAAPNLFMAGDVAAVGVGDKGGTYRAFDRETGEPLWRTDLETSGLAQLGGVMTTAAVEGNTILVTSNRWGAFGFVTSGEHAEADTSVLYALATKNGKERWREELDAPTFGSFAVVDGLVFHATIRGDVYARDVKDGKQRWKFSVGTPVASGLSLTGEGLYLSAGFGLGSAAPDAEVIAFSLSPEREARVDLREERHRSLTEAECLDALSELQPDDDCRACLCACDASRSGLCMEGCWEQAGCVIESCAEANFGSGEGLACYQDHCATKLLPPNVYQESIGAATCVQLCADRCEY